MSGTIERYTIESSERWTTWNKQIPDFELKEGWRLKVIAPFGGAMARFRINLGDASVSIYLDVDDSLGCVGEPYWEIYPYEGDVARFLMNETDDLIKGIDKSLSDQLEQEQIKKWVN